MKRSTRTVTAAVASTVVMAGLLAPAAAQAARPSPSPDRQAVVSLHGDTRVPAIAHAARQSARAGSSGFRANTFWWFVRTDPTQALFELAADEAPAGASVVITDSSGVQIWADKLRGARGGNLPLGLNDTIARGTYTAELVGADGAVLDTSRVRVQDQWGPITFLPPGDHPHSVSGFEQCSTVRWFYDARGEGAPTRAQAGQALTEIAGLAGLTLKQADSLQSANMVFRWKHAPGEGYSAVGGWEYVNGLRRNFVELNSADDWATGRTDLDRMGLLRHEVLHAFGFGHVLDGGSVMYPVAGLPTWTPELGAGEVEGLVTMYRPSRCDRGPAPKEPKVPDVEVPEVEDDSAIRLRGVRVSKRNIIISGEAPGLAGQPLRIRVRAPGAQYRTARVRVVVGADGAFSFERSSKRLLRLYVAAVDGSVKSGVLAVRAWRG